MTALSVVVACRDRATLLSGCLPAVFASLRGGDEVVVVDAASRSGEVAAVATAAGARVVRSERPAAAAARNVGWRAARHPLVAFLDDDCRPDSGWAESVAATLSELDAMCGRVVAEGEGHLSVLDDDSARDYRLEDDPAVLGHGANLAARRTALEAVAGWDERMGPGTPWPGAEDKDLLLRLLAAGCSVGYRPEPVVRHLQWRTRRQALRAETGYGRGVGALAVKGLGPGVRTWAGASARATLRDLRAGYRYGVASGVLRTSGILWGALTARRQLR
jgi:glycosyltransferase involved in cell wall biosynthesis